MPDPATAEEKKEAEKVTKAEERIKELDRRNKELERLVNMSKRLDNTEQITQQVAQVVSDMKKPAAEDDGGWGKFLDPKVAPAIEKAIAPLRNAIFQLMDEKDHLKTLIREPKYSKDPELQSEVEEVRRQRHRQTGILEPRENIITYMRGQNPDRFKEEETRQERREEAENTHVETSAGVGGSRADSRRESGLTTASTLEEMEKWFQEHPEDAKV